MEKFLINLFSIGSVGGALMRSGPNGSITILNKEYIRDIEISTNFGINVFPLNPGMSATFPWLSQVADSYEEYRIKGLAFTFKSTSTPFVQSQKSMSFGTIIMATQYNVNNPNFNNKRDMENYIGATSGSPLQGQMHVVRLGDDPLRTLYVRQGTPLEKNYDLKFYDCGKFELATIGMNIDTNEPNASLACGELWVSYEIELLKPRLRSSVSRVDHWAGSYRITGAWSNPYPMGARGYNAGYVPSVGTSRLGTTVGVGNWDSGGTQSQVIDFNQGHANRFFRIDYLVHLKGPGSSLTTNADLTKKLVLEWNCPTTLGTLVQGLFWKAGTPTIVANAPLHNGDAGDAGNGTSFTSTVFLKTNGMSSARTNQAEALSFRWSIPDATHATVRTVAEMAADDDIFFDLIISEMNEADFANY